MTATASTPATATVKRPRIVSRAEFARASGVSRGAVTKATKPGKRLHAAAKRGGIDANHPAARQWVAQKRTPALRVQPPVARLEPAAVAAPPVVTVDPPAVGAPPPDEPDEADEVTGVVDLGELAGDLGELGRLTLNELEDHHGNVVGLRGFIRARRDLEEARKALMNRLRLQSRLIPLRSVELLIGHIDTGFRMLLTDVPRAITARFAPGDVAAMTAAIRDLMSQHLERAKVSITESLEANDPLAGVPIPADPKTIIVADAAYTEDT